MQLSLILLVSLFATSPIWACWSLPPAVEWIASADGSHEYKLENREARVSAYRLGKRDAALWSVSIDEFDQVFSTLVYANNGQYIVHIRTDHLVNDLDDTAVEVYGAKGRIIHLSASTITDGLRSGRTGMSTDSKWEWFDRVKHNGQQVTISGVYGGVISLDLENPTKSLFTRVGKKIVDTSWYEEKPAAGYTLYPVKKDEHGNDVHRRWRSVAEVMQHHGKGQLLESEYCGTIAIWRFPDGALYGLAERGRGQWLKWRANKSLPNLHKIITAAE